MESDISRKNMLPVRDDRPDLSIHQWLAHYASQTPQASAILDPGRLPLSYGQLYAQIQAIAQTLNAMGLGKGDRIAIVMPNSPEMAVIFLAVATCAIGAPLNPNYQQAEFEFYLNDLNAKAFPPDQRQPGSVGIAAGPEIAIMDEFGNLLPQETIGEVVIRGNNVISGYENNSEVNAKAFMNRWFRTGDRTVKRSKDRYVVPPGDRSYLSPE